MKNLDIFPFNGDLAFTLCSNLCESTTREVDRIPILASRASISNGDGDGLSILGVGNLDTFTAETRFSARISVSVNIHGSNQIVVTVVLTAGAGIAILVEESGKATRNITRVTVSEPGSGRYSARRIRLRSAGERMAASVEETDIGMLVFTPNGKITLMVHCIVLKGRIPVRSIGSTRNSKSRDTGGSKGKDR